MEILARLQWTYSRSDVASPRKGAKETLRTLRRFPFSSDLKRMSVVAGHDGPGGRRAIVTVKGAPEVVLPMMRNAPPGYTATCQRLAAQGARVLVLGYREITGVASESDVKRLSRADTEKDLTFGGFVVVRSPIKKHSGLAVESLLKSSHHVVMITGDAPLTASYVARKVGMVTKPIAILQEGPEGAPCCHSRRRQLHKPPALASMDRSPC